MLRTVTLPLTAPGIGAGAALVFLTCMKELPATLLLRPTGMDTLATELWTHTTVAAYAAAAPYAALLVARRRRCPPGCWPPQRAYSRRGGDRWRDLTVRGVRKAYGPVRALAGVDLAVPAGALTAVLGPVRLRQDHPAAVRGRLRAARRR